MIESWPDASNNAPSFHQFQETVLGRLPGLRFAQVGATLFVMGTVPTYSAKALIDTEAETHRVQVRNCVRVIPGRDWLQPDSLSATG